MPENETSAGRKEEPMRYKLHGSLHTGVDKKTKEPKGPEHGAIVTAEELGPENFAIAQAAGILTPLG